MAFCLDISVVWMGVKRVGSPSALPSTTSTAIQLTKNFEFIQQASVTDKHFKAALVALKIRARRQYNCRHTYATMCLMAGMKLLSELNKAPLVTSSSVCS